jgi:PQQ-like domain
MSSPALLCGQCRAPLPAGTGAVTCGFCGATTTVDPPLGTSQVRAVVRQELDRRARPAPPPATQPERAAAIVPVIILGVSLAVGLGGAVVAVLTARPTRDHPRVTQPSVVTPPTLVPPRPSPPLPAPATGVGEPLLFALGSGPSVYFVASGDLVKADRTTQAPVWRTRLEIDPGEGNLVAVPGRVVVAAPAGAWFFDDTTGAPVGHFLWREQGFKVTGCATPSGQVLVKTVFDGTVRFDPQRGTRATGGQWCQGQEDIHCDGAQRCGFQHVERGDMTCRYFLAAGPRRYTFCELEGTKERDLVAFTGSRIAWQAPRAAGASTNPEYLSISGDLIIAGDGHTLEAFDVATGSRRWGRTIAGSARAVTGDGNLLFVGAPGTVVALDARTGDEVLRFHR